MMAVYIARSYSRLTALTRCQLQRYFSSNQPELKASSSISQSNFRCTEQNPANHDLTHATKYYVIPPDVQKTLFTHGGITREHLKDIKTFHECALMIRKPALEVINYLKKADYSMPVIRYALYGDEGVGKTVTLAHVLHFASTQNWLLIHVPWVPLWTRVCRETTASQSREGRFDQSKEAVAWLQQFKSQNSNLLKTLDFKTSQSYTWSKREITEQDKPITDVIDHGINRIKFASDCVAVILKEIKLHANAGKLHALVVIDGVNALFNLCSLKREDKSRILTDELTLIHAFKKLIRNDWKNGAVVTSVDLIANHSDFRDNPYPFNLLGKDGFEVLDPFIPIKVDKYSREEASNCLDYYIERNWIQTEGARSERGKKELSFLSGRNPQKLAQICTAW